VGVDMKHFLPIFSAFIGAFVCIVAAVKRKKKARV
jgi:hypothetical protein